MAKATAEKKYISFIKGLVTEASPLTFPENASIDEDNFNLELNGSRSRRLGIDYEAGHALTATGISSALIAGSKQSFHRWDFPDGDTTVSIGIVRIYNKLWFVNLLNPSPSATLLNAGNPITISGLNGSHIEVAQINTHCILVSADLDYPILLSYNKTTQLVTQENVPIQVRDIWGVVDGISVNTRPASLDNLHNYNLQNQGWSPAITSTCSAGGAAPVSRYWYIDSANTWQVIGLGTPTIPGAVACAKTTLGVYPSNADVWTLGKVGVSTSADYQKFDPNTLKKNAIDNLEVARGSMILDAFARGTSRYTITGLTGLPEDKENGRLSTVAAYAGRIFYSGVVSNITGADAKSPNYSGFIFFSQIVSGKDRYGKCYQEADPTSETISDIIDTDGGTIHIPEISRIIRLVNVKDSLMVFAENGVWEIYGDTGGFKATNFQVAKVSSIGISNPRAVVVASNNIVYWAKSGIFVLTPDQATGRYTSQNLSITTIQTFYNGLTDTAKRNSVGFYDEKANTIRWLYNDTADYSETNYVTTYNRQLNLDLTLQAFYKYSISPLVTNSPYIMDFIEIPNHAYSNLNIDIYADNNNVLAGVDQVQVTGASAVNRVSQYNFLTLSGTSFTISKFSNTSFVDWQIAGGGTGVNYSSYLLTGYELFEDIMRTKQVPYIFFYLTRTEDGFSNIGGNLIANNQSSCLVQSQWNWTDSITAGKWGSQFQAYRYVRNYIPSGVADTFDTGDSLIVTKNILRGSGKALSLKIQSEPGKDMKLLGWALTVNGGATP